MKKLVLPLSILAVTSFTACQNNNKPATPSTTQAAPSTVPDSVWKDHHTWSNYDQVVTQHLDLDLNVDFARKTIAGKAVLHLKKLKPTDSLVLDTRDLKIVKVTAGTDEHPLTWKLGSKNNYMGTALHIQLPEADTLVQVYYETTPGAVALQWLSPQQTAGKKHPFLYTQSEAIMARSWVPCQDGPGIRFTYNAKVTVPKGLMALMSAENPQQVSADGVYQFKMDQPIPAYLLALAVGDLSFKSLDNRTGVYADPVMIDKAAYELAETGKMVNEAEKLYGPYRWGRYDVLVLPPAFPLGGMENPKLTFATPTIIAGDRSLTNLIAHELAHNWSGNLVTNATWNDFWLNEGFTVYFERRISEAMFGADFVEMMWELSLQDLNKTIEGMKAEGHMADTHLKLDLKGRDPDEGLTDIAYEKGALFLRTIEVAVGREKFDAFVKAWFTENAFKPMVTEQFLVFLNDNLLHDDAQLAEKLKIKEWIYGEGIPDNYVKPNATRFAEVDKQAEAFMTRASRADQLKTTNWSTYEWLQFLRKLKKPLTITQMSGLDAAFKFTATGNSEIAMEWYLHVIAAHYTPGYTPLSHFLETVGRRKFLEPLYSAMVNDPQLKPMAKSIYAKARAGYHPLAQGTFDELVGK